MKQKIHGPHRSLNNCWEKQLIVIPRYCWNWPSGSESKNPHSTTLKRFSSELFRSPVFRPPSVRKLFIFSYSSPEPLGQFQPKFLGWSEFKFVQMMVDNSEIAKIHGRNSKIFFPQNNGPISTKLGHTMHLWVKWVQICSNEKPFNSHKVFLLLINVRI